MKNAVLFSALMMSLLLLSVRGNASEGTGHDGNNHGLSIALQMAESKCQIAIWISDSTGAHLADICVSKKTAQKGLGNRRGNLDAKIGGARWSVLPVWAWSRGVLDEKGNPYPSKDNPLPDAITCASPKEDEFTATLSDDEKLPVGPCTVWLEINESFDQNEHHDYSWYRGQPSVVYRAEISCGDHMDEAEFVLVGMGSVDGMDGSTTADISTLTTALHLLVSGEVRYIPNPDSDPEKSKLKQ